MAPHFTKVNCVCLIVVQVCHYIMSCLATTTMPDVPYSAARMKHDNELEVQGREQIFATCSPVTHLHLGPLQMLL